MTLEKYQEENIQAHINDFQKALDAVAGLVEINITETPDGNGKYINFFAHDERDMFAELYVGHNSIVGAEA